MTVSRFSTQKTEPLRTRRPAHIRPPMDRGNRAKQFAPFAALGSMEQELLQVQKDLLTAEDIDHGYEE